MDRRTATTLIILPLVVIVPIAIIVASNADHAHEVVASEFAFSPISRVIGIYLASIAAIALLVLSLAGASSDRFTALVFPLLAGLAMSQAHWSASIALAAVCFAAVIERRGGASRFPKGDDSSAPL